MAKNFQTTQGPVAFCMRGHLDLDVDGPAAKERGDIAGLKPGDACENVTVTDSGYTAHVGITRIHMEEDAGKMIAHRRRRGPYRGRHAFAGGLQPRRHAAHRAGHRARSAHARGSAPVHAEAASDLPGHRHLRLLHGGRLHALRRQRVSLRRRGSTKLGVKTELKNMNSFKNLHDGLAYEICRQAEVLEEGGQIYQETRHWDPTHEAHHRHAREGNR